MFTEIARKQRSLSPYREYPPASDRDAWEGLPSELRVALIQEGEKYLGYSYSMISAVDYMEFCRNGNRTHYEDKQFSRRLALNALVLAECAEYKGRFMDDILNGVWLICEESGWQLPAHNSYEQDGEQLPLPDITRPIVDLFAAETGAVLAVTEYLLRDAFAAISPAISVMIGHNLEYRIFRPYLSEHFWWMGDGVSHVNNWTPWCTQNVLLAAFTRPDSRMWDQIFRKSCRSLDYFLAEYGEDGCCDEGAQYYRHAALTLFNAVEVLNYVSGGSFAPVYRDKKICNMAAYILNVHVAGPYYINFADCSPRAGRCGAREYLFGKRTGNSSLARFAARDYRDADIHEKLDTGEHNTFYRLQAAFCHREICGAGPAGGQDTISGPDSADGKEPSSRQVPGHGQDPVSEANSAGGLVPAPPDIFYPSAGLFIARDSRYCLAVKAGDNADSHNHNDTGSFTIYKDGRPLFIDIGVESYTRKTFSPRRYEIWTMQSAWHNLPTIGGIMQKDGSEYKASQVEYSLGPEESSISMDIARAYPDSRILSYVRRASLKKGERILVEDSFRLAEPLPVVLSLITCEKPVILPSGDHETTLQMQVGTLGLCRVTGAGYAETEEVPIHDPRLAAAWPRSIFRTRITAAKDSVSLEIF